MYLLSLGINLYKYISRVEGSNPNQMLNSGKVEYLFKKTKTSNNFSNKKENATCPIITPLYPVQKIAYTKNNLKF